MASRREQAVAPASNAVGPAPILLFGMPRSGTTWIGKLFDSHPDTLYLHEPDNDNRLPLPRFPTPDQAACHADAVRAFVAELPAARALGVVGKRPFFAKSYLSRTRALVMAGSLRLAIVGSRLYRRFPLLMYRSGDGDPRRRLVWKSVESLSRLGLILEVLKNARAIHILRHPCGYIASVQRGLRARRFSSNASSSEDYGIFGATVGTPLGDRYGLTMRAFHAMTREQRHAWRWVLINEKALLETEAGNRRLCVRYEDICRDPQAQVRAMFDFAGLAMTEQTRAFIKASTSRTRGGYYSVFKNPRAAAWQWQHELDADTVERVMAIVRATRIGQYYTGADAPRPEAP